MSGAAHSRITLDDAQKDDIPLRVRKVTDKTVSMLKEHYVTALYNAFTEDGIGRRMKEGKFFETPLHADSGGLQIVTRGMVS